MRVMTLLACTALIATPAAAFAQGTTQTRDGLGNASHPAVPNGSEPAGSINAASGPQAAPAYPSGSTTPNPGAAFVRNTPVPSTGTLQGSPGAGTTPVPAPTR